MNALTWSILGYVALQLAIGLQVARRVRSEDDFLVAGRRLDVWAAGRHADGILRTPFIVRG